MSEMVLDAGARSDRGRLAARGMSLLARRLSTDNPFYVLSALLVFVGLKLSFGDQATAEQTWGLMLGLGGYTLLLAVPAVALVRVGSAWDDLRTVLLLVVLTFLAMSVTFDETLERSPVLGVACCLGGLGFSALVSEGILRGIGLRLPMGFRGPYYLALGLFFLYPLVLLPWLDAPRSEILQWALFGFSPAAGLVALTLLPAARRGADYVRDNGGPWTWPLYPWVLFGALGVSAAARSYLLCWSMQHVEWAKVVEPLIFGPYFLAPLGFAIAVLLLEIGQASGAAGATRAALLAPWILVVLSAAGHRDEEVYRAFLDLFTRRLGATPLSWTLHIAAVFYLFAAARRIRGAWLGLTASLAALTVVGPATLDLDSLSALRPGPLAAVGLLGLVLGAWRRDSLRTLMGAIALTVAVILILPEGVDQAAVAFHMGMLSVLLIGAAFQDPLAKMLRGVGATLALFGALASLLGRFDVPEAIPPWMARGYPLFVAAALLLYGWGLRHRWSMALAAVLLTLGLAGISWRAYESIRGSVRGLDYIVMGLILLVLAQAISAAKAGVLERWLASRKQQAAEPWI